jgi:oligosaccharide repeat unit polymerase
MNGYRVSNEILGKSRYFIPLTIFANLCMYVVLNNVLYKNLAKFLIILLALSCAYLTTSRLHVAFTLVYIIYYIYLKNNFEFNRKFLLLLCLVILLVGPLTLLIRGGYGEDYSFFDTFIYYIIIGIFAHGNAIESTTAILERYINENFTLNGTLLINNFSGWIPKTFKSSDNANAGTNLLRENYWIDAVKSEVGSPATSLLAESLADFGIAGIIIMSLAIGFLIKYIEVKYVKNINSKEVLFKYVVLLFWFVIYLNEAGYSIVLTITLYFIVINLHRILSVIKFKY